MNTITVINTIIGIIFSLCYLYQIIYIPIVLSGKFKVYDEGKKHRFAVLICARNEEKIIPDLIKSIKLQTYGADLINIFVIADNCTDNTALSARSSGATVYERNDTEHIGKGYALESLIEHIKFDFPKNYFDGYFVFDADNVLDRNYISEMNKTFSAGNDIITSYRNSKNFGSNWISAGYGLWFLREAQYLNGARSMIGSSAGVSGTGFFFSSRVLDEMGSWKFHLLTEDIEFTVHNIVNGEKIAYCPTAVFYDEQPTSFIQSWHQRIRWTKGYIQVFRNYGKKLIAGIFHGSFSCYDITMSILPAAVLSIGCIMINLIDTVYRIISGTTLMPIIMSAAAGALSSYLLLFFAGAITTVTEWKNIRASAFKKLLYTFTFPIFMATYIPIAVAAIFSKAEWRPIVHTVNVDISKF